MPSVEQIKFAFDELGGDFGYFIQGLTTVGYNARNVRVSFFDDGVATTKYDIYDYDEFVAKDTSRSWQKVGDSYYQDGGFSCTTDGVIRDDPTSTPAPTPTEEPTAALDKPAGHTSGQVASDIAGFTLEVLRVPVGTTVTWTNQDNSGHTVTAGSPEVPNVEFASLTLNRGDGFSHTFQSAGTFLTAPSTPTA